MEGTLKAVVGYRLKDLSLEANPNVNLGLSITIDEDGLSAHVFNSSNMLILGRISFKLQENCLTAGASDGVNEPQVTELHRFPPAPEP